MGVLESEENAMSIWEGGDVDENDPPPLLTISQARVAKYNRSCSLLYIRNRGRAKVKIRDWGKRGNRSTKGKVGISGLITVK